jgi:hypothetical protein
MTTFTTEIKTIQTQIDTLNEDAKNISEKRNELMTERTLVCGVVFINSTAKGSQAEKQVLTDASNKTTSEKTFGFWRRVGKLHPELKGADKPTLAKFMEDNDLTSWRKIDNFGKEPQELSPEAEALIEAMMLVCQDEGTGIVEGDGERDKVQQALIEVILKLEKSVK